MRLVLILLAISLQKRIHCHDSESAEVNRIEITPFYDTIIFNDVIDIINELNRNSPFNAFTNSDSESDENVEDLLSDYQRYLDKAHEQRRIYLEKSNKTKNKVPTLRHDTFVKANLPSAFEKYNSYYSPNQFYNSGMFKYPPTGFSNPLDLFVPINPPLSYFKAPDDDSVNSRKLLDGESPNSDKLLGDKKTIILPPLFKSSVKHDFTKSPCMCTSSTIPCKCNCKQCFVLLDSLNTVKNGPQSPELTRKVFSQNSLSVDPKIQEHLLEDMSENPNTINVKIKVDVQLPKMLNIGKQFNRDSATEYEDNSKELTSNIRIPTTSFNFPVPLDMFGYRRLPKISKHDSAPFRKITIHKRKKSRPNSNSNKKHRKKLIAFHNVKMSPAQTLKPSQAINVHHNASIKSLKSENLNETIQINAPATMTLKPEIANTTTTNPDLKNSTQFEESIYFMVNISHNNENDTDEVRRTGNSIELDPKTKPNISTPSIFRKKRDIHVENNNQTSSQNNTKESNENLNVMPKDTKFDSKAKKAPEKGFSEEELLYWPITTKNKVSFVKPSNITDIILQREHKKTKLNITKETIRNNRTKALEQAIFGQVDWDDMDAVAPTFLSFVGKYINGIVTFCSQKICHSMKCAEKTCIHRVCKPEDRFNHIGHCSGSNKTDSVASMESIMDLPSNVVFEIVDMLQDKMLGKIHGKVTLCINLKCITFAASKKIFIKSKCVVKSLNKMGHCPNMKKS
ncbi:uncharacterized protein LOC135075219 [Ostrinia nubilalis]|uniref:uncharacterized protein LOC135075219 n=1 Tax=Ostrinia nubilalis TaxID=29057 RepID=UPI0030823B60